MSLHIFTLRSTSMMKSIPTLLSLFASLILIQNDHSSLAGEPLIFISSFAAGDKGAIEAFSLDSSTGRMNRIQRTTGVEHPFFFVISPDQKFLYSIHAKSFGGREPEEVAAYALEGRTGRLKLLNRQSTHGTASCYVAIDATGKTVLVANYTMGSVASFPVQNDGSLGAAASIIQHVGSSIDPVRQKGPNAHCIVISPDNRFAFAADLGTDQVLSYRVDKTTAKLTPNTPPFSKAPAGAGPRHLTFHPDGKHVYVINELQNSVTMSDYDANSGVMIDRQTISTLPTGFQGVSHCADLKITPNGKFLYGTNRGHDSIACYRIEADGSLKLIAIEPSLGKGPQNLLITGDGKRVLCANMPGNSVAVFEIDDQTGRLKSIGEPFEITSPSCIRLLP